MSSFNKKISLFVLLCITLTVAFGVVRGVYRFVSLPLVSKNQSAMTLQLPPGKGVNYLIKLLNEKHLLKHPVICRFFALLRVEPHHLKAGEYEITPGTTFPQLLNKILVGQVMMRSFTIIEGWTFDNVIHALQDNPYLKHKISSLNDQQILALLGSQEGHPEGLFYPDTYSYTWGESDIRILQQAYKKMSSELQQAWKDRAPDVAYQNPYQALIVASLVEKETALAEEKPLIAAVILNRLKQKIRLQVDPSVIYGLGPAYRRPLTHSNLQSPTPYNTYRNYGLPPTPIALPSKASLVAAMHPAQVTYLFYVARGDGSHQFSETYESHLQAIKFFKQKSQMTSFPAESKCFYFNPWYSESLCKINQDILFH